MASTMRNLNDMGANPAEGCVTGEGGVTLGALTFAFAQAGRVVQQGQASVTTAVTGAVSEGDGADSVKRSLLKALHAAASAAVEHTRRDSARCTVLPPRADEATVFASLVFAH